MYGKLMSIPDTAMRNYAELVTSWHPDTIDARFQALAKGLCIRDLKMELARKIVGLFHTPAEVEAAEQHFVRTPFSRREIAGRHAHPWSSIRAKPWSIPARILGQPWPGQA